MEPCIPFPVFSVSSLQQVADACDTFRQTGCAYFNFINMEPDLCSRAIDFLTGFAKGYDCCLLSICDTEYCMLLKDNTVDDVDSNLWGQIEFTQHAIP